ncbi:MAG: hypothetical protein ABI740_08545 [Alphaproteobacteria bacterium]
MNKKIIWWVLGVVVAIGAGWLIASPSKVRTGYDKAVSLAQGYGDNADERQAGVAKSLAAAVPLGPATDICLAAKKALQQQRITVKAFKTLPAREDASVSTEMQVAGLLDQRIALLLKSVTARTTACGGPEPESPQ